MGAGVRVLGFLEGGVRVLARARFAGEKEAVAAILGDGLDRGEEEGSGLGLGF